MRHYTPDAWIVLLRRQQTQKQNIEMSNNNTGLSIHHKRLARRLGLSHEFWMASGGRMSVRNLAELVNTTLKDRHVQPADFGDGVVSVAGA